MGLVYFHRFAVTEFDDSATLPSEQEIIAFCPKWLLTAHATPASHKTTLFKRSALAELNPDHESSTSDFFSQLHTVHPAHEQTFSTEYLEVINQRTFQGGLAGFIGYDLAGSPHNHPTSSSTTPQQLIAAMGDYDIFLKKEKNDWVLYGPDDQALSDLYRRIHFRLTNILSASGDSASDQTDDSIAASNFRVLKSFRPIWSKTQYCDAFDQIQSYLHAGDCYQVNLTQPFIAKVSGNLLDTLDDLLQLTQAPYAGYMRVGAHELLSCSPELFLAFTGHTGQEGNTVITRPIKGTFPRSADLHTDIENKNKLFDSEKDQSENLMIVDLLRNDLSRHAIVGSVKVPVLFEIESFAQVHHLVSEVRAQLDVGISPLDVLIDALPGGSITGAPKKRAMEIIAELEARPRGAYCGSFGYLNHDGSGQFNILIRTLQKNHDELVAWAGGGITVASQVDAEYQECLDKIGAILSCVNQYYTP
ncbi:anthranilate synthase component I family protein [Aquirhabdus sp.]|uniref:anthranilate synthase component I family protein n=1 Tax=Aquirhabdus sp. TaxID=2824160 RepID=UPI00396C6EDE